MSNIFGPVPSRRLGFSLGLDIVPFKTCGFDCVYCECGETTNKTLKRDSFIDLNQLFAELKDILKKNTAIEYITFAGGGEPTLNTDIEKIINRIKDITDIPVALLTNSMLMYDKDVRADIINADIVMPSLDAVSVDVFNKINRPVNGIDISKIIDGLINFRKEYSGQIFLEILFVKGINDKDSEIKKLVNVTDKIAPDKVQLNTCVRPGTESDISPLSYNELLNIAREFNIETEIISSFSDNKDKAVIFDVNNLINMLKKRPCTVNEICKLTNKKESEIEEFIKEIRAMNIQLESEYRAGQYYYFVI